MAGTTGSSGLNNFLTDTNQVQTTLPTWYDAAQQGIVNQAKTAQAAAPQFQNTVAQSAVNTLSGANNPFTQAQGSLNQIATGAANPWITDPTTGQVTPNTQTAMGGLFAAQQQQLNQLLPTMTAPAEANAIGSGNFGSLRGQTSVDTAKTNALANLQAQQMQSALQNQSTGASAANALGNVGAQGISAGLTTGTAQMNAPFQNVGNYANLVNAINVPATVSQQNQTSPLSQIGAISNALGSTGAVSSLLQNLGVTGGLSGLAGSIGSGISSLFGGNSGDLPTTDAQALQNAANLASNLPGGMTMQQYDAAVNGWIPSGTDANGNTTYVDVNGDPVQ